jgi:hypothetical protein
VRVRSGPVNAVLSGVFLDPLPVSAKDLPHFSDLQLTTAGARLNWEFQPGAIFRVRVMNSLRSLWESLPAIVTSENGNFGFEDPVEPAAAEARFYQLELLSYGEGSLRFPAAERD